MMNESSTRDVRVHCIYTNPKDLSGEKKHKISHYTKIPTHTHHAVTPSKKQATLTKPVINATSQYLEEVQFCLCVYGVEMNKGPKDWPRNSPNPQAHKETPITLKMYCVWLCSWGLELRRSPVRKASLLWDVANAVSRFFILCANSLSVGPFCFDRRTVFTWISNLKTTVLRYGD